jgi:ribA/ribD-fused uncharacterized protein
MSNRPGIYGFFGEYRWLSNFWMADINFADRIYPSNEHFYQAWKAKNWEDHLTILAADGPKMAKDLGRNVEIVSNWEKIKLNVMKSGCEMKFEQNPDLKAKLLATGDLYLEETNHWGDTYWGVCNGVGQNKLGIILMSIRDAMKYEKLIYG